MNTTDTPIDIKRNRAYKILKDFMNSHKDLKGDAFVCTHDEWLSRGEPYGQDSLATMAMDGSSFYNVFNGYTQSYSMAQAVIEKLTAELDKADFYYELGFAWTLHIYEI